MTSQVTDERRAALLATSAAHARRRFDGRRGRLSAKGAVHDVSLRPWFGVEIPGPACHIGVGGWDFTRFQPTSDAVTCRRCLRGNGLRAAPVATHPHGAQLALDLDALAG
jgi:hypothetical protein